MQKKIFPIILTAALLLSSVFALFSLHNLQGNARTINYAGVVRGATQRLIKQELNHQPNDKLISRLDDIIAELLSGKGEIGLVHLDSQEFQNLMLKMQGEWEQLKEEIYDVRDGGQTQTLFEDSERYFELADQAVIAAEKYSEKSEFFAEKSLLVLNCAFILIVLLFYIFNVKQTKRQKELQRAEEENQKKEEHLSKMAEGLRGPMNDISELMYISDTETYELLFLNKKGCETFHVDSLDGQKCYRVLQGKEKPCEFCTTTCLKEGENYTWEHTNPLTGRHYLLKDRLVEWEGRPARMEIAFDTTDSEKEKIQLKFTLDAEKMITECVRTLYQHDDIVEAIMQVLKQLGMFLSADRAYIIYIRKQLMYNDFEWCKDGINSQQDLLQAVPVDLIERWIPYFMNKDCVIINNLEDIRESSPEEYEILHEQLITSLVVAPLERDGQLIGYIGVDNPPPDRIMNIAPLLQTLCYFIMLASRQTEIQHQLKHMSYFDKLTSFYNRNRYIEDTNALAHSEGPIGIVFLDVNGLKDMNDQYGHEYGDKILIECARRMKHIFGEADFYRIGGDEFVIICPGIDYDSFSIRLHGLKARFKSDEQCKAAIGAQWMESVDDLDSIIAAADAKMYEDKKAFYRRHPATRRYRHHNDEILHLSDPEVLQEELADNHFAVYLQPKISSDGRMASGAEALIRYLPKPDTLVLPGDFLPMLEEFETISMIDFYVFRFVCEKLKCWMEQGKSIVPVSVNFSNASLKEPFFAARLLQICESFHVSPKYIEIEITEKVRSVESLNVKEVLTELRSNGFTVVIDDFGTEYANLALLSEVEFDVLKLDKSMIDNITFNPRTKTVVETIVGICRRLGIVMVAEGIETEEQFSILCSCGVELFQGFLFSRPVSAEEYEEKYLNS